MDAARPDQLSSDEEDAIAAAHGSSTVNKRSRRGVGLLCIVKAYCNRQFPNLGGEF